MEWDPHTGALETAARVRQGEWSAVEVTQGALARAERFARLGAFAHLTPERALGGR